MDAVGSEALVEQSAIGIVDVGDKPDVDRRATAVGSLKVSADGMERILSKTVAKGDVFEAGKLAGLLAVKATPMTLPHCHPIPIDAVHIEWAIDEAQCTIECSVSVRTRGRTGAEMDALNGLSAALLCIWDMVKPYEKDGAGQYPATRVIDMHVHDKRKSFSPSSAE